MFEPIDNWLVRHNFNPIWDKSKTPKNNAEQRSNRTEEVEEDINLSVQLFQQAAHQLEVAEHSINSKIKETEQEIKFHENEIKDEEGVLYKLQHRKVKARKMKQNLNDFINPEVTDEDLDKV